MSYETDLVARLRHHLQWSVPYSLKPLRDAAKEAADLIEYMANKHDQCEPDAEAFANQHVETFVEQYNDVYCDQRKAGVGGGDAERAAMRQVLILALGAFCPAAPAPDDARDAERYRFLRDYGDEVINGVQVQITKYGKLDADDVEQCGLLYVACDQVIDRQIAAIKDQP